jgi:hypothetical protein
MCHWTKINLIHFEYLNPAEHDIDENAKSDAYEGRGGTRDSDLHPLKVVDSCANILENDVSNNVEAESKETNITNDVLPLLFDHQSRGSNTTDDTETTKDGDSTIDKKKQGHTLKVVDSCANILENDVSNNVEAESKTAGEDVGGGGSVQNDGIGSTLNHNTQTEIKEKVSILGIGGLKSKKKKADGIETKETTTTKTAGEDVGGGGSVQNVDTGSMIVHTPETVKTKEANLNLDSIISCLVDFNIRDALAQFRSYAKYNNEESMKAFRDEISIRCNKADIEEYTVKLFLNQCTTDGSTVRSVLTPETEKRNNKTSSSGIAENKMMKVSDVDRHSC